MKKLIDHAFNRLSPLQRSLVSAFSALFGYGGWAYLVNSMHGTAAAVKAATVQGGYSFALTFVITLIIEGLHRWVGNTVHQPRYTQVVTVFLTCALLFSSSWWINAMAGTPEIFSTVILGYVIGTIYTATYVVGLSKGQSKALLP